MAGEPNSAEGTTVLDSTPTPVTEDISPIFDAEGVRAKMVNKSRAEEGVRVREPTLLVVAPVSRSETPAEEEGSDASSSSASSSASVCSSSSSPSSASALAMP
jgi:hypothetical protein